MAKSFAFEDIMSYCPDNNWSVFEDIARNINKITPFIGAGISKFIYPLWKPVLRKIARSVKSDADRSRIISLIDSSSLFDAAQEIENCLGEELLVQKLFDTFSEEKIDKYVSKFAGQAVSLFPELFPNASVITTNFDRIVERAYAMHNLPFESVVHPNQQERQNQMLQGDRHCLFKIHGDIGSDVPSYNGIAFTRKQYDRAYGEGQPLRGTLCRWFQSRYLLFLGCSLTSDKTMELLSASIQPGLCHFAIVECASGDREGKIQELRESLGVHAIVYPKGKHDAVKIILDRLLHNLNQNRRPNFEYPVATSPLTYSENYVPPTFQAALEELEHFYESSKLIEWWAIRGPTGSGKSFLVSKSAELANHNNWQIIHVQKASEDSLQKIELSQHRHETIIVIDCSLANAKDVQQWLQKTLLLTRHRKLRILLIERDDEVCDQIAPALKGEQYERVSNSCYRSEPAEPDSMLKRFLPLLMHPLNENELRDSIGLWCKSDMYSAGDEKLKQLFDLCKSIGADCQPIYAQLAAKAYCSGNLNTDATQFDVLNCEISLIRKNCRKMLSAALRGKLSPRLLESILCIRAVATIYGSISMEDLSVRYPTSIRAINSQLQDIPLPELLRRIDFLQSDGCIAALQPELLGLHFVWQQVIQGNRLSFLFPNNWSDSPDILLFIYRIIKKYASLIPEDSSFWSHLFNFPHAEPKCTHLYTSILVAITNMPGISGSLATLAYNKSGAIASRCSDIEVQRNFCLAGINSSASNSLVHLRSITHNPIKM